MTGDVELINSALSREEGVIVGGQVHYTAGRFGRGLLVFGLLFGLGTALAVLVSGLLLAGVAPHSARMAGATLTGNFGKTLLATLLVWIGLPLLAILLMGTIVGIPVALGILVVLLPALGFLGYLAAGIRLGDYVIGRVRGSEEAWHPYLAAVVGLGLLLLAGLIPLFGSVITPLASFLGAGALALVAWSAILKPRVTEEALTFR